MVDILATFQEGIEAYEEGIGGELPALVGLLLVLEIGLFELGADVNGSL